MLTLTQKHQLGTKGEFIAKVLAAISMIAVAVTHEKPNELTFADIEGTLDDYPEVKAQEQLTMHRERAALAMSIINSTDAGNNAARRAAALLSASIVEQVASEDEQQAAALVASLQVFLQDKAEEQHHAIIDALVAAVVAAGWSSLAGYNVYYRVPLAIAEAQNAG